MSRALWHFAVVTPQVATQLELVDDAEVLEHELQALLRRDQASVAMCASVLDAWDGVYLPTVILPELVPAWSRQFEKLIESGVWWLAAEEIAAARDVKWQMPDDLAGELGAPYAKLVLGALETLVAMQQATQCRAVIIMRILGSVIADDEYRHKR